MQYVIHIALHVLHILNQIFLTNFRKIKFQGNESEFQGNEIEFQRNELINRTEYGIQLLYTILIYLYFGCFYLNQLLIILQISLQGTL